MARPPVRSLGLGACAVALAAVFGLAFAGVARGDDRATAEAILAPLEHDEAHKAMIADAVKRARDSLERATRMRDANDEARARLSEGVGLGWAEVARDLIRASEAEGAAIARRASADDAGARAERERAMLEEAIARQGRLRAELDGVDRTKRGADRTASAFAGLEAGAPVPPRGRGGKPARGAPAGDAGAAEGLAP